MRQRDSGPRGRESGERTSRREVPPKSVKASSEDRIAVVRLRFHHPFGTPLSDLSRAHPELEIRVTATQMRPQGGIITEFEAIGPPVPAFGDELRRMPGVFRVDRLAELETRARYRAEVIVPPLVELSNTAHAILRYPRVIRGGEFTVEVAATVPELRNVVGEVRRITPDLRVLRFGREEMRSSPRSLTPGQHRLLCRALALGYFDVPRRISLTKLAGEVGLSKSWTSRALAIVEKQLVEGTLVAPT